MVRRLKFVCLVMFGMTLLSVASNATVASPNPSSPRPWPTVTTVFYEDEYPDVPWVDTIQYLLRSHGYQVAVDGDFGNQTSGRVSAFQRAHHLPVTGSVDAATWERLVVPLRRGSRGNAVRALQCSLDIFNSGRFDFRTERAVRRFQRVHKLPPNGVVDETTWMWIITNPPPVS